MPRIEGASGPVTMRSFCHLSPVKLTSASITDNSWHPPVTPEIQMGSVLLCLDGISVHCAPVSTKALYSCGSDVLVIESIQSSIPGHPSPPPPGQRQGPSIPVPGQSIHYLTFVMPNQRFPHQDCRKLF